MTINKESDTEQRILEAAEEVFHEKGYNGTRMREIAERAGTNKGLLHYYFKTKERLFEAIFSVALHRMMSRIQAVLEMEMSLDEKIDLIVDQYMLMILKNPALPRFVLNELNKNPERFIARHIDKNVTATFERFQRTIQEEVVAGKVRAVDARQLLMNLMSMIIFPFVGRPLLQTLFGAGNEEFDQLLKKRKEHIKEFIKQAIRV